jgi:hypothetical protein
MGLDICAYSNIVKQPEPEVQKVVGKLLASEGEEILEVFEVTDRCHDLEEGVYLDTFDTVQHHFRAGSYSGYNRFRNILSRALLGVEASAVWEDPTSFEGRPGYEMIDFSDCEGTISSSVADKLRQDLAENREVFATYLIEKENTQKDSDEFQWIMEVYDNFIYAFELASENGVVVYT